MGKRIICADALRWLANDCPPCAIVTSPPEMAELQISLAEYEEWYGNAIGLCMRAAGPGCPVVVYATDRKAEGQWVSKPALIVSIAKAYGWRLLWHRIVLRRDVGKVDLHRPGYAHLLAVGPAECRPGVALPDVMERGHMLYPDAMGFIPGRVSVNFAGTYSNLIIDPFCGRGTVPAIAEALGFEAIGVDIDPTQCAHAEKISLKAQ